MSLDEQFALELAATLLAAYPTVRVGNATAAVYQRFIGELDHPERAAEAIAVAIRESDRLPSVKAIRDAYRGLAAKYAPPALDERAGERPLDAEQRAELLERIRAIARDLGLLPSEQPPKPPAGRQKRPRRPPAAGGDA